MSKRTVSMPIIYTFTQSIYLHLLLLFLAYWLDQFTMKNTNKKAPGFASLDRVAPAASFGESGLILSYSNGTPRIGGRRLTLTPSGAKSRGGAMTSDNAKSMGVLSQFFIVCLPRPRESSRLAPFVRWCNNGQYTTAPAKLSTGLRKKVKKT
jgi:hypothetical protein